MQLTSDQVKKVAKLANLPISNGEENLYAEQLSKILDYIEDLNKADTSNIDPTYNVTGKINIQREDQIESSLSQEAATKNALVKDKGLYVTKGVFEEE